MNCLEVETIVTDLARNTALETEARHRALAHLKDCRRCNERLMEEKKLSEGLLAWAAASMNEQAPPRVEEKLLAAFRRQPAQVKRGRGWIKIAAAGSVAAAVLLFELSGPAPHRPTPIGVQPTQLRPPSDVVQVPAPRVTSAPAARIVNRRRRANRAVRPVEIGTEFLPVAQGDAWTPLDGGRLVRVGLPRSAMGVFGLPVDEERAPERVQADVVLSDDGILRAIRFVR